MRSGLNVKVENFNKVQLFGGSKYDFVEVDKMLMLTKSKVYCDRNVDIIPIAPVGRRKKCGGPSAWVDI